MRDVQTKFPRGKVVRDRYIVEELLGKGGFGAVYRVRDRRVKSNVFALKELVDPDKQQRDSFAFECEVLKRLDHRALPRVYRVFEDSKNNRVYMLMDYIEGANLEKLRRQQPEWRFPLPQAMKMMAPIVDAIIYLHAQHPPIIHRDIKPSNIIVPSTGDGSVLVDFGIAKEYDQDATTMAVRHCSPGYGAPEQYARGTDTRTDIYGLAATFYTLLTGEVPIDALLRMTRLGSKYTDPLEPVTSHVPAIPSFIADALQRAMSININDRFATVEEFWQALNAYPIEEPATEEQEQPSEPIPKLETLADDEPVNRELPAVPVTQPVSNSTLPVYEEPQTKPVGKGKNRLPALLLTALALVALLTGAAFGARMLPGIGRSPVSITTSTIKPALTATQALLAATPTAQPTATPTPQPT
ncbi:MAG: serine/threonine protein kinase, partial [Chloroflexi bacterium]|nr:serine/threonine protein kinase [Chloroflexota bacterium]